MTTSMNVVTGRGFEAGSSEHHLCWTTCVMSKGVKMKKVLILACILLILVTAVVLAGCGGGSSSSGTPEQAAEAFWAAALKQDTDATWSMLSSESQCVVENKTKWTAFLESLDIDGTTVTFEVGKATIEGDQATLTVEFKADGKEEGEAKMTMVKEDGTWKYHLSPQ